MYLTLIKVGKGRKAGDWTILSDMLSYGCVLGFSENAQVTRQVPGNHYGETWLSGKPARREGPHRSERGKSKLKKKNKGREIIKSKKQKRMNNTSRNNAGGKCREVGVRNCSVGDLPLMKRDTQGVSAKEYVERHKSRNIIIQGESWHHLGIQRTTVNARTAWSYGGTAWLPEGRRHSGLNETTTN